MGFNSGGMFRDPAGTDWYVKVPPTRDHVKSEILAARLYAAAGIRVPVMKEVTHHGHAAMHHELFPTYTKMSGHLKRVRCLGCMKASLRMPGWETGTSSGNEAGTIFNLMPVDLAYA